ncbi:MAG: hypothetical protein IKC79_00930, partial [Clostridia bacterium]|nr:hypothetical protein [Clostridia bacterium]
MLKYKWSTYYLCILNLVVTLALIFLVLPATVPMHVNAKLMVDAMASPLLSILPFALLPVIVNSLSTIMPDTSTDPTRMATYRVRDIFIVIYDIFSIIIGWLMFTLAYSGARIGVFINISPMLIICVIPALILFAVSAYLPTLNQRGKGIHFPWLRGNPTAWQNTQRLACILGIILSALIFATALSCFLLKLYKLGYLLCGLILLSYIIMLFIWSIIYSQSNMSTVDIETQIANTQNELDTLNDEMIAESDTIQELDASISKVQTQTITTDTPISEILPADLNIVDSSAVS